MSHELRKGCTERKGTYRFEEHCLKSLKNVCGTYRKRMGTYPISFELRKGCTERIGTYNFEEQFVPNAGERMRNVYGTYRTEHHFIRIAEVLHGTYNDV